MSCSDDDGEIGRFETMFQAKHGHADGLGIELLRIGPIAHRTHRIEAMIGKHATQAFGRTFRPRRQQHALAAFLQRLHMRGGEFEDIHLALRALGREIAARLAAGFGGVLGFRRLERRKRAHLMMREQRRPFLRIQIKRFGLQRLVGRRLDCVRIVAAAAGMVLRVS